MVKYFSKVWYILKGSRKSFPWLILLFVLSSVLEALGIGLIGPFLNLAQQPDRINEIPLLDWSYLQLGLQSSSQFVPILGLVIAVVFCIKSVLYFLSQKYIFQFSFNQKGKLISKLLGVYLSVPYVFYLRKNTASIIKNTIVETDNFTMQCLLPLLKAIANLTVVFVLVLLLAQTDLLLFVMILAIFMPTFLLFYKLKRQFKQWGKEISESSQEIIRVLNHSLGSIKDTRVIGCESYFHEQMERQVNKFATAATSARSFQKLPRIVIETCLILFLVLFISIYQIFFEQGLQDLISILAVFAVAAIRLIPAASISIQAMGQMQNASYSVDMLYLDLKEIENQEVIKYLDLAHSSTIGNNITNHTSSVSPTFYFY